MGTSKLRGGLRKCYQCGHIDMGQYCSKCGSILKREEGGLFFRTIKQVLLVRSLYTCLRVLFSPTKFFNEFIEGDFRHKEKPIKFYLATYGIYAVMAQLLGSPTYSITFYDTISGLEFKKTEELLKNIAPDQVKHFDFPVTYYDKLDNIHYLETKYPGSSKFSTEIKDTIGSILAKDVAIFFDENENFELSYLIRNQADKIKFYRMIFDYLSKILTPFYFFLLLPYIHSVLNKKGLRKENQTTFILMYIYGSFALSYGIIETTTWNLTQNPYVLSAIASALLLVVIVWFSRIIHLTHKAGFRPQFKALYLPVIFLSIIQNLLIRVFM